MLINPFKTKVATIPGTRILEESFGLTGFQYTDPREPSRAWALQYLLAPIRGRALGGIRAKFVDSKGFVSFCNQRDLEIITGIAQPGDYCPWLGDNYPGPEDKEWFGLCTDTEDLLDDLQDRELRLREQYPGVLPSNLEIVRRIHDEGSDSEELMQLLWDMDIETGQGPDPRLETIERRWVRVERTKLSWIYADQ
jgi:hypothetical protein